MTIFSRSVGQAETKRLSSGTDAAVTNEDIADFVEGVSDAPTTLRVLAAALTDEETRSRIGALGALDAAFVQNTLRRDEAASGAASGFSERAARLKADLKALTGLVALEQPDVAEGLHPRRAGSLIGGAGDALRSAVDRALVIGRQLLTLPCLAPAMAAPAADMVLRRQSLTTGDGVRIEFQQLPGPPPYKVRVIVDASALPDVSAAYDIACLSLEQGAEGGSGDAAATAPPPREHHILIVTLNERGRGMADYTVGTSGLPAPTSSYRLVAATLSHSS